MQLNLFKKRKYNRQKIYIPSSEQVQRMLHIKKLYDEFGTLQKVADHLKVTRERVRQQLNKGQEYRLFQYKLTSERILNALIKHISRDELVKEIQNGVNRFDVCSKFNIDMNGYLKLLKFYQIDIQDYMIEARHKKYLIRYSNIVSELGHHPSTTEMQHTKKSWRYTGLAIAKIWGNIDRFRKEYGIEKPPHYFHPNTKLAWQKRIEAQKKIAEERVKNIKRIINAQGPISLKDMSSLSGYKVEIIRHLLNKLLNEKIIRRIVDHDGVSYMYFLAKYDQ